MTETVPRSPAPGPARRAGARLRWLVPLWLVLALTVTLYFEVQMTAHFHPHTGYAFAGLEGLGPGALEQAWHSRVLSLVLGRWTVALARHLPALPNKLDHPLGDLARGVGLWVGLWFAATGTAWVVAFGRRSLWYVFASFAAVAFGYMPGIGIRVYPWDLPALFAFSLWLCLYHRGRLVAATALIPLAVAFKESAAVLSLGPLLTGAGGPRRWRLAGAGAAAAVAVKLLIDRATANTAVGLTMMHSWPLWHDNLRALLTPLPWLVNGGTLVALFLLPGGVPEVGRMRRLAGLIVAGNLLFGTITEYRIWFEAIPFALYGIDAAYRATGTETDA